MAPIKEPWPLTAARYTKDFMRDKSGSFPRMKHERYTNATEVRAN